MKWNLIDSAPRKHGERFLAWNPELGAFVAEWFRGIGYVFSWNQDPCNFICWTKITGPKRTKGSSDNDK